MHLRGVVFNRVHREMAGERPRSTTSRPGSLLSRYGVSDAAAARLAENFDRYETIGRGDGLRIEGFRQLIAPDVAVVEVPNLTSDVHSVDGLRAMHPFLCDAEPPSPS
jgi:hypothetical protein